MSVDPQSAILVYLLDQYPDSATIRTLAEATGLSITAVRNNLSVMASRQAGAPWVEAGTAPAVRGRVFSLTSTGHRVAGYRRDARQARDSRA